MVAIELAASCRPFRKSKASATAIRKASRKPEPARSTCVRLLQVLDQHAADPVGDVFEPVDHLLEVVIDLGTDDVGHGIAARGPAVEGRHALVVDFFGTR